jgi:hypothetical protein
LTREVPALKVDIGGGIVVHVDTIEELREVVRAFSTPQPESDRPAIAPPSAVTTDPGQGNAPAESKPLVKTPRGARYVPSEVKIRSASTEEALFKLYKALDNANHRDALRYLAAKGEKGASIEDLRAALNLPANHKMGGWTAAIRRRAPAYGLDPEDVLIVEYRGIVANTRILDYRLGPQMLDMMKKHGFVMKAKTGKEE